MRLIIAAVAFIASLALAALVVSATAEAAERATRGGYPACPTKEALEDALRALKDGDQESVAGIPGCFMTEAGLRVEPVRMDLMVSKVRIISPSGEVSILWTDNNNIKWVSY